MKKRLLLCALILSALPIVAQTRNQVSNDILDTYNTMIAADPNNADLYLSRAGQYQSIGRYAEALDDLNRALQFDKGSDKSTRYAILCRRANIRRITADIDGAIADLSEAIGYFPEELSAIDTRARLLLSRGDYDGARADFNRIRRIMPRNQQAIFGLARVEALSGNSDKAIELANEAAGIYPSKGSSFIGRAEILKALGRPKDAIDQYIRALFCNDASASEAAQKLVDLSYEDYASVAEGYDRAILEKPTAGILYYLRGSTSAAHNHHLQALEDMNHIDGTGPFAGGALNVARAESMFALGRYPEALKLLADTPVARRNSSYYSILSRVQLASGLKDNALEAASQALRLMPESAEAMANKARVLMAMGRDDEASSILAEAILTDSSKPIYYLLRAAATGNKDFYEQLLDLPYEPSDPNSLRGFAYLGAGQPEQARAWISSVMLLASDSDGSASYIAAALSAQLGDTDAAFRHMEQALKRGYSNAYQWISDNTPLLTVAPLRSQPKFAEILDNYASIFR